MTIFLHIGSHKTGTTAIQRYASGHRKELRKAGLWYPSYAEAGLNASHYAHHHAASAVAGDKGPLTLEEAERFFAHVCRNRRRGENVLISAEPIYRQAIVPEGKKKNLLRGEAFWSAHRHYLERLRAMFDTDDLKMLVVFRRQDSFAPSMYQEHVKTSKYGGDFRRFIRERHHVFDYLRHARELSDIFPAVMARPFDRLLEGNSLVESFFSILGVQVPAGTVGVEKNESLPHELVEFKRLINKSSISWLNCKLVQKAIVDLASRKEFSTAAKYHWIPLEEMEAFQQSFDADNRRLHEYTDFPGGEAFFSDRPLAPAEVFPGLSEDRTVELAMKLMFA